MDADREMRGTGPPRTGEGMPRVPPHCTTRGQGPRQGASLRCTRFPEQGTAQAVQPYRLARSVPPRRLPQALHRPPDEVAGRLARAGTGPGPEAADGVHAVADRSRPEAGVHSAGSWSEGRISEGAEFCKPERWRRFIGVGRGGIQADLRGKTGWSAGKGGRPARALRRPTNAQTPRPASLCSCPRARPQSPQQSSHPSLM